MNEEAVASILIVILVVVAIATGVHFIGKAQDNDDVKNISTCIEAMKTGPLQYESSWANRQGFCTCMGFILRDGGSR